jgi:hypothetical protein
MHVVQVQESGFKKLRKKCFADSKSVCSLITLELSAIVSALTHRLGVIKRRDMKAHNRQTKD